MLTDSVKSKWRHSQMLYRLTPKQTRVFVIVFTAGVVLVVAGMTAYATHIRQTATALIESARDIRTTADAQREIAAWKNRSGQQFWQESDHPGGDHNYDAQIDNILLSHFGV